METRLLDLKYDTACEQSYLENFEELYVDDYEFRNSGYSDLFLIKVYQYYINKGYKNIIIKQVTNLLNTTFLVLFTLFLFNCVDYGGILNINNTARLSDFIIWSNYFNKMNFFSVVCFIILIGFIIAKILKLFSSRNKYRIIKMFYNITLNISDDELLLLEWNDITKKLIENTINDKISSYTIAKQIMRKENYIIALFSNDIIKSDNLTNLVEWSFIYCIVDHFFDQKNNLREEIFNVYNKNGLVEHIKRRLKIVAFLYVIFMPFIFIFLSFKYIFFVNLYSRFISLLIFSREIEPSAYCRKFV